MQLQVLSGDHYEELGLGQRLRTVPIPAARGSIFDRDGLDFAMSIEKPSVYADPTLVTDPAMYASQLAPVVGTDPGTLLRRLSQRDRRFVYVARTVEDDVAEQVRALRLPGVGIVEEPAREYPAGSVAASVVGRVGSSGEGLDGLELRYDDLLAGTPGEVVTETDQHGREIPDTERRRVEARRGTDLVLSIDQKLQYFVERSLTDQVTATGARGGMAVVVEVATGDVLAMATVQGATADEPARPARATERNRPVTDLFEPGSTNKLITIAAAIEHGVVGEHQEFDVPATMWVGEEKRYSDDHRERELERWSTTDILRESSNVGTIMIAEALGKERFAQALRDFGLASPPGIDFPGATAGLLLDPDEYYETGLASSSLGYGVAVTAMHVVGVYATIANGGTTVPPRLVRETIDADGERTPIAPSEGERVVSERTAEIVGRMLTEVVRSGTGTCAAVRGYTVAGKTGTSKKALPEGGYSDRATMASFAGFAPAGDPRLAAIVVIDEPGTTQYGSRAAAPVFSEIMQYALIREDVPRDDTAVPSQYDEARARAAEEGVDCAVPHGADLARVLAERAAPAGAGGTGDGATTGDPGTAGGTLAGTSDEHAP
ncbi:MAG: penicillin-binding protein [Acidimicrobiia bacterium]|nr:MAG: penicillin-binding protein [Acidimicrobiia bacterium]